MENKKCLIKLTRKERVEEVVRNLSAKSRPLSDDLN